jgi:hypothetical protein
MSGDIPFFSECDLPIPRIQPQNFENGEWLRVGSGKLLLAFTNTVILGSGPRETPDSIFLAPTRIVLDSFVANFKHLI